MVVQIGFEREVVIAEAVEHWLRTQPGTYTGRANTERYVSGKTARWK